MNMTLTRRGDYVVRAALRLAISWGEEGSYCKIREVAEDMELPRSYTPQVLGFLARAGLAEAKAGRHGGYRLARPPKKISLLEVVEAAEGPLDSDRCALRGGPCRWDDACAFHPAWSKAAESLKTSLSRTSLADVAEVDRRLAAGEAAAAAGPFGEGRSSGKPRRRSTARRT